MGSTGLNAALLSPVGKLVRTIVGLGVLALVAVPAAAQRGGFSGHASGHASGHFSGRSGGHGGGSFFGHFSGGRSGRSAATPIMGMQMARGGRVPVYVGPRPALRSRFGPPTSRPIGALAPAPFQRFHHFHRFHHFAGFFGGFGAPFCEPFWRRSFFSSPFFFNNGFPCFGTGFIDSGFFFWDQSAFAGADWMAWDAANAPRLNPEQIAPNEMQDSVDGDSAILSAEEFAASEREAKPAPPVTLLELEDGSMYGLTDYWVEGGELHYVTDYGGKNAVPLERINLEKTVQLNAEKGLPFILRSKAR